MLYDMVTDTTLPTNILLHKARASHQNESRNFLTTAV